MSIDGEPLPTTVTRARIGVNDAVAAAVTRLVGSMPALYAALVLVSAWMVLATVWGPLRHADHYPFPFLLFLNNLVQLVLCSVILVGQRVLGLAADRRAVQTYESAEAIFAKVADLQAHLDRHDRALGRGVSLLDSSPHPWVQRHRVQPPPQAIDQVVGVNGRIAAWLTQRLGSMWAFYLAAGTQVAWIGLALLGVQRFDAYPFKFMSLLSTFAQLVFMLVIMVGQDVIGRAADLRSEQTFLDAEAILHECGRMKARLEAQDRVINSLADYTSAQVTERLAHAIHETYLQSALDGGEALGARPAVRPWEELPEHLRASNHAQARRVGESLAVIGCLMVPADGAGDTEPAFTFEEGETDLLARLEHERYLAERDMSGPVWEALPADVQDKAVEAMRRIPALLAGVGFRILREISYDSPGESDFTPSEWAALHRSLLAAGALVSLAEGVIDADEISALRQRLREAGIGHPRRFLRELAASCPLDVGVPARTRYADYEDQALHTIRTATAVVARKAPGELDAYRAFVVDLAMIVADANEEGGFFGLGARARTPNEAAAIQSVTNATTALGF